jgi:hypothetical protein
MALFASSSEIAAMHRELIACLAFALVALACGNTASNSGGSGGGGAAGGVGQGGTGASASPDFTGVWKGYVDGYAFDDGSNSVTLTLDSVEPEVFGHVRRASPSTSTARRCSCVTSLASASATPRAAPEGRRSAARPWPSISSHRTRTATSVASAHGSTRFTW